jgi:hypothetical protein
MPRERSHDRVCLSLTRALNPLASIRGYSFSTCTHACHDDFRCRAGQSMLRHCSCRHTRIGCFACWIGDLWNNIGSLFGVPAQRPESAGHVAMASCACCRFRHRSRAFRYPLFGERSKRQFSEARALYAHGSRLKANKRDTGSPVTHGTSFAHHHSHHEVRLRVPCCPRPSRRPRALHHPRPHRRRTSLFVRGLG